MTKTIEQRLQSRISRRRNFIRFMEDSVAGDKASRLVIKELDLGFEHVADSLSKKIAESKRLISGLADDQRLDKALKNMVVMVNTNRRHYGLSDY